MGLPVLVGFNGGPWFSPGGPFNSYWKTAQGGRFLARYKDGQVNASIQIKGSLKKKEIEPFLGVGPYDRNGQDALDFTLSPYATPYRRARLKVLALALAEWRKIDQTYPGTIEAFTTDSEVSDFSFRRQTSGDALPIGYETAMTKPFCRKKQDYRLRRILPRSTVHLQNCGGAPMVRFSVDSAPAVCRGYGLCHSSIFPLHPHLYAPARNS